MVPASMRLDQRRFVDHAATRDVHKVRGWLHRCQNPFADDAACFRGQRRQRHEIVEFRHHLHQVAARHDAIEAGGGAWATADADDFHAEGLADWRQIFGDQTDAENADGLAFKQLRRPALPGAAVLRARGAGMSSRASDSI